ncbi:PAS domain-containing protein [Roseomonas sp. GC11]|uniref:sensor histidine kinase n=1 Tax=Roseomonas sp. GC11 TaxID=2950546 RepID=UPI00210895FD|nr:PAS domain-containing sensor histidine kinase [Roseomonas sp. GC11]MCQ4162404.1 PAS domain-containing protein [Roseomonas sp. GC11]
MARAPVAVACVRGLLQASRVQAFLAVGLLLLSSALLTQRVMSGEATTRQISRLQEDLQKAVQLRTWLQGGTEPGKALPVAAVDRTEWPLPKGAEDAPELVCAHARLMALLSLRAGQADPVTLQQIWMTLREMEQAVLRRITSLNQAEQMQLRLSILVALLAAVGAVGVLAHGLRRALHEAQAQAQAARQMAAQMLAVCNTVPVGLAILDSGLRVQSHNPRLASLLEMDSASLHGAPLAAVLPPLAARLATQEDPLLPQEMEIAISNAAGGVRGYFVALEPVAGLGPRPGLCLALMDVTERIASEARRDELVSELNHRVKNTLATVQSLAAQTLRGAALDPHRFAADFSTRLAALSRSHELLAAVGWAPASLPAVVHAALLPWAASGRLAVEGRGSGPLLRPGQAQSLVIALTEMAGNAARHGALRQDGHVCLRWEEDPAEGTASLLWQEQGGAPLPGPPAHRGFGLRFLERGLAHDLGPGTQVRLHFPPEGLRCEIRFPIARQGGNLSQQAA